MNEETIFGNIGTTDRGITIKSPREIDAMRKAGEVVAKTLQLLIESVYSGMRTSELDKIAYEEITRLGAKPSFKGYLGFPSTICVSINEEIVHGIPGDKIVQDGDIISIDIGAIVDGFHGDHAITIGVGNIPSAMSHLIETTKEALNRGISVATHGARTGDIGWAVQSYAEEMGYSVVREYVGHGIGKSLHEEPQVPNYGTPGSGTLLKKGMVIAIEPMLNIGSWETRLLDDKWTVVTSDGSLSAHFEHTLAITEGEAEVLTQL
jgi:methionyl aminopeptidase